MKVTTSKGDFVIQFRHVPPIVLHKSKVENFILEKKSPPDERGNVFINEVMAGTYCTIHENDHRGTVIAQAQSFLSPLDKYSYNKETGRKVSLTRALKKMYLTREERRLFWDAYLNRRNA